MLARLRLVLLEEDAYKRRKPPPPGAPPMVDYAEWHAKLRAAGFDRVWYAHDSFSNQPWAKNLFHSAWARGGGAPRCKAYKQSRGLSDWQLQCVE